MIRQIIPYTITLQAPMVLTQPGGDANSAETLPYISGASLLGALAAQWKRQNNKQGHLALDPVFSNLFLQSRMRCSHAYPVRQAGGREIRLLPSPLSLWVHKRNPTQRAFDFAHVNISDDKKREAGLRPWQPQFIQFSRESIHYTLPKQQAMIHHQRDRNKGRATKDGGSVFSYISLSAGQKFKGYLFCETRDIAEKVKQFGREARLFLGRSKTAQYGGNAYLRWAADEQWTDFVEAGKKTVENPEHVVITLVSDYLGRDVNGHFRADKQTWLRDFAQNIGLKEQDFTFHHAFPAFARIRYVSGYVAPWSMPRPVRPALQAGTVLVFRLNNNKQVDQGTLREVLWTGLGDRRAEGFGRFVIDWHGHEDGVQDGSYNLSQAESPPAELCMAETQNSGSLNALCQKNLLQRGLSEKLQLFVADLTRGVPVDKIPKKSALGRVRQRIKSSSNDQVRAFLEQCPSADNANKPFIQQLTARCIKNRSLLDWLQTIYTDDSSLKVNLQFDKLKQRYYLVEQDEAEETLNQLLPGCRHHLADLLLQELSRLKKKAEAQGEDNE
jgi:CRISPR-associated Csx10 family RAMP protein